MKIYRFAKYVWCWDIISGDETYAYVEADTEEEAIEKRNKLMEGCYCQPLHCVDCVDEIPQGELKLLLA
tara:strand:- start:163 stop:369 length:207 start_codon:yes stop_codon:yes gene_type:complete